MAKIGFQGLTAKDLKDQGLKHKRKGCFINTFELEWTAA